MGSIYLRRLMCRLRRLTVWSLIFLFFLFFSFPIIACVLTSLGPFTSDLVFSQCVPFLGSKPVITEGVRVSWTSTDVRKY